ncbi:unnamed protein product [Schistosoma turkestanicum]|nr:unnamed protein product [Schistosoma turkestanicum]
MNNSLHSSYRYYPPVEFTPTTPPPNLVEKYKNSTDLCYNHRVQNDSQLNYSHRNLRTDLNTECLTNTCEPVNTSGSEMQFIRNSSNNISQQTNNIGMKKNLQNNTTATTTTNNNSNNTIDIPVFHGRQRSMPIFMPSYTIYDDNVPDKINNEITIDTENSHESNRLTIIDKSTRPNTTSVLSNSTTDTEIKNLPKIHRTTSNSSSLNLVIDIHLHGVSLPDNRMTQSCIQEQNFDKSIDDKLLNKKHYSKCSMEELLTNMNYCTLRDKSHRAISLIDQQNSSSQSSSYELNTEGSRLSQRLNKLLWNKQNDFANRINSTDTKLDNVNENKMKCSMDTNGWNSHIHNYNHKSDDIKPRLRNRHQLYNHHQHHQHHQHSKGYDQPIYMDQTNGTCTDDLRLRRTPMPVHRQLVNNSKGNNLKLSSINRYPTMPNIINSSKNSDFIESNSGTFSQSVDIPLLIRLLQSSDPDVVSNAAAYLQHLVYRNPSLKEKTRLSGGISALVQLLYSDHTRICLNAVGVLRNLTCGDTLAIKKELERVGGIRALAWLIENRQVYGTTTDSFKDLNYYRLTTNGGTEYDDLHQAVKSILENAASVLCNLASVSWLKRSVLQEALIPSLLNVIIVPAATETSIYASKDNGAQSIINSILFRIVTSLIRNISSSEDDDVREQMRQCPQLATSLFSILRYAVEHQLCDKRSIEHCVCTIRNLCYGLQQRQQTQQLSSQSSVTSSSQDSKSQEKQPRNGSLLRIKSASLVSGRKSKRSTEVEAKSESLPKSVNHSKSDNIPSPYGDVDSIRTLIYLIQYSSNPYTLEAAAGSLQNLTAGNGNSSEYIREIIRLNHGLPLLVELLTNPMHNVVATAANALRNSALDSTSCYLIGKYALNRIIHALDQHSCGIVFNLHSNHCKQTQMNKFINTMHHHYNNNHINNNNNNHNHSNCNSEWQLPLYTSNSLANKSMCLTNHESVVHYEHDDVDDELANMQKQCTTGLLSLCCVIINKKLENAR